MKTKVTDPDFLAQLNLNAYKTRLETDLTNLKAETEPQLFFIITEHKFADGNEGPLFVVGATLAWRDFIKDEVKNKKNPNFTSGECKIIKEGNNDVLQLELHKGKAKPMAIEKAFKKNANLKTFALKFVDNVAEEGGTAEMEDSLKKLDEVKSNNLNIFKTSTYDTIKAKVAAYKQLNPQDAEGRKKAIDEILALIEEWHKRHPKPSGNEQKIAEALKILDKNIREQISVVGQTKDSELFYDILEEYNEVRNLDFNTMDEDGLNNAKKEAMEVMEAIKKWNDNNDGIDAKMVKQQRDKIVPILERTKAILADINKRLLNKDILDKSTLPSPAELLKNAGVSLKDSGVFAKMVNMLEDIQSGKDSGGKTIEEHIHEAQKNPALQTHLLKTIDNKRNRLTALLEQAQKWQDEVGAAFKLGKESKERNEQKKKAVEGLINSVKAEILRAYKKQISPTLFYDAARNDDSRKELFYKNIDMDLILSNQSVQNSFVKFLEGEFSTNNFELYLHIHKGTWKKDPKSVYLKYVKKGAEEEVNVSEAQKKEFNTSIQDYLTKNNIPALANLTDKQWEELGATWENAFKSLVGPLQTNIGDSFSRYILAIKSRKDLQKILWKASSSKESIELIKGNPEAQKTFFLRVASQDEDIPFNVVWEDSTKLELFRLHCIEESNIEPFDFLQYLKKDAHKNVDSAKSLYENYLTKGSNKELNLSGSAREKAAKCVALYKNDWKNIIASNEWDEAIDTIKISVLGDLKYDTYPRFISSLTKTEQNDDTTFTDKALALQEAFFG